MKILTEVFSGLILTCFSAGAFISCTSTKKAESLPKIDMTAWNYNEAERSGTSTANLIAWIKECLE